MVPPLAITVSPVYWSDVCSRVTVKAFASELGWLPASPAKAAVTV